LSKLSLKSTSYLQKLQQKSRVSILGDTMYWRSIFIIYPASRSQDHKTSISTRKWPIMCLLTVVSRK